MNRVKDIEDMYKLFIDKKFSYFTADKLNSQNAVEEVTFVHGKNNSFSSSVTKYSTKEALDLCRKKKNSILLTEIIQQEGIKVLLIKLFSSQCYFYCPFLYS